MIRGIIFDCFGVLHLDSNTAYFSQFPDQEEALHDLNVRADRGLVDRTMYLKEASLLVGRFIEEIAAGIATGSTLNEQLAKYIASTLKPHYKIGLLSNMGRGWVQSFFNEHQIHDLFDAVVLSSEEGITKPNPIIFERTAERLGLSPSECLMVDDRQDNCDGAIMVGVRCIRFTSNAELIQELAILNREEGS